MKPCAYQDLLFHAYTLFFHRRSFCHSLFTDMYLAHTILQATLGFMIASATGAQAICNSTSLNTTSFNYYNDVENQTIHDIAIKFNRGVCDIGRANLSASIPLSALYRSSLTILTSQWSTCPLYPTLVRLSLSRAKSVIQIGHRA